MKHVTVLLTLCFLALAVVLSNRATPVEATDYDEDQLIAVKVEIKYFDTICTPDQPCPSVPRAASVQQINCLLAPGASYKEPTNPTDTIVFFGRTTCNYPVPNLENPDIKDLIPDDVEDIETSISAPRQVQMWGVSKLKNVTQGAIVATSECYPNIKDPDTDDKSHPEFAGNAKDICQRPSTQYEQEDWGVTAAFYERTNLVDTFSVIHESELVLPEGWVWIDYPSDCTLVDTGVLTCLQQSPPFHTPPNPGVPADRY